MTQVAGNVKRAEQKVNHGSLEQWRRQARHLLPWAGDATMVPRSDMTDSPVVFERMNGVARVTLNRPPLNLLRPDAIRALRDGFEELARDPTVRVAVLTGSGRAFTAGMDVRYLVTLDVAAAK